MNENTFKIELRNIKFHLGLSEETTAFNADIYVDGKKAGSASNRGHGDPVWYQFDNREVEAQFEAFIKAQPPRALPPSVTGGVEGLTVPMCGDLFFGLIVEDALVQRETAKLAKRLEKWEQSEKARISKAGFIPIRVDLSTGTAVCTGVKTEAEIPALLERLEKKYKTTIKSHKLL
jgi:hypothetical protein